MSTEIVYKFGNLRITAPTGWLDITSEIEDENPPFSLARPTGVGVIQFSTAEYRSGKLPTITLDELCNLLTDFAQSHELGRGHDLSSQEKAFLIRAGSFDMEDRFLRVWYCSNGRNIALVTYNCQRGIQQAELPDCEMIVRNLKFVD